MTEVVGPIGEALWGAPSQQLAQVVFGWNSDWRIELSWMFPDPFLRVADQGQGGFLGLDGRAGRIAFRTTVDHDDVENDTVENGLAIALDAETKFLLHVARPLWTSAPPSCPGGVVATPWCKEVRTGPYDRRAEHVKIQPLALLLNTRVATWARISTCGIFQQNDEEDKQQR